MSQSNFIDLTGQKFGKLLVVERSPYSPAKGKTEFKCICDCGRTKTIEGYHLRKRRSLSCGCSRRKNINVGARVGRLTVMSFAGMGKNYNAQWLCKCDCGKQTVVRISRLISEKKKITSCGCIHNGKTWIKSDCSQAAEDALFAKYQVDAAARKKSFGLSKSQAHALFVGNCHYCGVEPSQKKKWLREGKEVGVFIYNGIDRIDSKIGYEIGNVVSCCSICNRAKNTMPVNVFESWLKRIAEKWTKIN